LLPTTFTRLGSSAVCVHAFVRYLQYTPLLDLVLPKPYTGSRFLVLRSARLIYARCFRGSCAHLYLPLHLRLGSAHQFRSPLRLLFIATLPHSLHTFPSYLRCLLLLPHYLHGVVPGSLFLQFGSRLLPFSHWFAAAHAFGYATFYAFYIALTHALHSPAYTLPIHYHTAFGLCYYRTHLYAVHSPYGYRYDVTHRTTTPSVVALRIQFGLLRLRLDFLHLQFLFICLVSHSLHSPLPHLHTLPFVTHGLRGSLPFHRIPFYHYLPAHCYCTTFPHLFEPHLHFTHLKLHFRLHTTFGFTFCLFGYIYVLRAFTLPHLQFVRDISSPSYICLFLPSFHTLPTFTLDFCTLARSRHLTHGSSHVTPRCTHALLRFTGSVWLLPTFYAATPTHITYHLVTICSTVRVWLKRKTLPLVWLYTTVARYTAQYTVRRRLHRFHCALFTTVFYGAVVPAPPLPPTTRVYCVAWFLHSTFTVYPLPRRYAHLRSLPRMHTCVYVVLRHRVYARLRLLRLLRAPSRLHTTYVHLLSYARSVDYTPRSLPRVLPLLPTLRYLSTSAGFFVRLFGSPLRPRGSRISPSPRHRACRFYTTLRLPAPRVLRSPHTYVEYTRPRLLRSLPSVYLRLPFHWLRHALWFAVCSVPPHAVLLRFAPHYGLPVHREGEEEAGSPVIRVLARTVTYGRKFTSLHAFAPASPTFWPDTIYPTLMPCCFHTCVPFSCHGVGCHGFARRFFAYGFHRSYYLPHAVYAFTYTCTTRTRTRTAFPHAFRAPGLHGFYHVHTCHAHIHYWFGLHFTVPLPFRSHTTVPVRFGRSLLLFVAVHYYTFTHTRSFVHVAFSHPLPHLVTPLVLLHDSHGCYGCNLFLHYMLFVLRFTSYTPSHIFTRYTRLISPRLILYLCLLRFCSHHSHTFGWCRVYTRFTLPHWIAWLYVAFCALLVTHCGLVQLPRCATAHLPHTRAFTVRYVCVRFAYVPHTPSASLPFLCSTIWSYPLRFEPRIWTDYVFLPRSPFNQLLFVGLSVVRCYVGHSTHWRRHSPHPRCQLRLRCYILLLRIYVVVVVVRICYIAVTPFTPVRLFHIASFLTPPFTQLIALPVARSF